MTNLEQYRAELKVEMELRELGLWPRTGAAWLRVRPGVGVRPTVRRASGSQTPLPDISGCAKSKSGRRKSI